MYSASNAFHKAVADGEPQIAMLIFKDCVFTNGDINVEDGIQFRDYFNLEKDLSIGQTPSNEISFSLFNDDRLLNSYGFGDFLATIGVLIGTNTYVQPEGVYMVTNLSTWVGRDESPFLTRNGRAVTVQPSFAVKALLGYDGKVWAFSGDGRYAVYRDSNGDNITSANPVNAFMKNKSKGWAGKGIFYNKTSRILFIYEGGERSRYEFVPLGWFTAERPNTPDMIEIDMNCNDFMLKFDVDMPEDIGVTYPTTIGNLLRKICEYVGVPLKSSSFINSTATINKRPDDFDSVTMREVIQWIAEAAGGNARIDRDGKLVIDWLHTTTQKFTESDYATFDPYWYKTKKVTKLNNRASDGSYENTTGSGDEEYLIQDNPLLKGVT